MVVLTEVANKLQKILNGVDAETTGFGHLNNYIFSVATEGFHLDTIADTKSRKNFIPVFIGSLGGNYEPLIGLEQADYTIPVTIYYPVRFKDDFYLLNEYLIKYFVGTQLRYGAHSGKCLSNISVAQYGELEAVDLDNFNNWVNSTYKQQFNITEMYMSMSFNLYLSSVNSGYVFGNSVSCNLKAYTSVGMAIAINGINYNAFVSHTFKNKIYNDELYTPVRTTDFSIYWVSSGKVYTWEGETPIEVGTVYRDHLLSKMAFYESANNEIVFNGGSIQFTSDPNAQQLLGTNESEGLPTITANSSSFVMYVNTSIIGQSELLGFILDGQQQTMDFELEMAFTEGLSFKRSCYIQSVNIPVRKGELITITLTFSKKVA